MKSTWDAGGRTHSEGRAMSGFAAVGMLLIPVLAAGQSAPQGQVTFTKDIAPILQRSCENCHRSEGVAPMALSTYEDVRPWAKAVKLRTSLREMPPWYIEKNIGIQKFKDDPSLSDSEIAKIAAWVDSGMPRGNPADMPPPRKYVDTAGWEIGTPDLIVSSPVLTVKAVAPDWFGEAGVVPTGLTEDRYVKAVEFKEVKLDASGKPAARAAGAGGLNYFSVHHAIVRPGRLDPDQDDDAADAGEGGGGVTPGHFERTWEIGQNAMYYSDEAGLLIPGGMGIDFSNLHLHSIGKEVRVRIDVALKLHPKGYKPKYSRYVTAAGGGGGGRTMLDQLDIPGGQDNVRFDAFYPLSTAARLVNYEPHMHVSGKRFCLEALYPNGLREMLNCSGYNHAWVKTYTYEEDAAPLLPNGTILHIIGWYDNSSRNKMVPDPRNWKGWGNRSVDDMFLLLSRMVSLTEDQFEEEVAARKAKDRLSKATTAG